MQVTAQKRVLVYGDSITWGRVPSTLDRHGAGTRWTSQLQVLLGDNIELIEEGLRGRTLYDEHPLFPERNGLTQFGPIFASHLPLDVVCVFLGTNNCTTASVVTDEHVYQALDEYCTRMDSWSKEFGFLTPRLALIQPPHILDPVFDAGHMFYKGQAKNIRLRNALEKYSQIHHIPLFDAAVAVTADQSDGIHLDAAANTSLASSLYPFISQLLA